MNQSSRYTEYEPSLHYRTDFACVWTGETGADGGYTDRVLPDACIDVIWDGQRLFVAGPDTGPVIGAPRAPGSFVVGARFRPGHAPSVLGVPALEILDQRVALEDLWGERATTPIRDSLAGVPPDKAARVLEARVGARAPDDDHSTALVDGVLHLAATTDIDTLASDLGVTTRTLHRRCVHRFGYGAKMLQQVLRFRRFLSLAEAAPAATLARLAADAGYADQSHLTRDCNRMSGLTPSELLVSRRVRSVQDDEWLEQAG
jgi:AraC-like DNA-binding protein